MTTETGEDRAEPARRGEIWVFAHAASLNAPAFAFSEVVPAILRGYHRRAGVGARPARARRSPRPQGLDHGGSCKGVAFRVPAVDAAAAIADLWGSESRRGYRRRLLPVQLADRRVEVVAFTV